MTSPLGRKVALVMYFGLWGVASCWKAWSLLAPLEEKRAKAAMGAGRVSVPGEGGCPPTRAHRPAPRTPPLAQPAADLAPNSSGGVRNALGRPRSAPDAADPRNPPTGWDTEIR